MKLVIILGPSASGKMTVAQQLSKLTGLKVFHNHMSIEPVLDLFGYFDMEAIDGIRKSILERFVFTENIGIIHTFVYSFDNPFCKNYIQDLIDYYEEFHADVYVVELNCSLNERLRRNETENRLLCKPSKRNIKESKNRILLEDATGRFESNSNEIFHKNYIKINNENLSALETAKLIKTVFRL